MLRYQQPADEVFRDVVQEALDWIIEDLGETAPDSEAYPELLPQAARFFELQTALETLERLRTCSVSPELYQPAAPHRVLLSDALMRYCTLFNEEPFGGFGSHVHEKYGLRRIDCAQLITAFLGEPDEDAHALRGKRLRVQDLGLRKVAVKPEQPDVTPASASPWYRPGAEKYPMTVTA
jgi:hypothetical protein